MLSPLALRPHVSSSTSSVSKFASTATAEAVAPWKSIRSRIFLYALVADVLPLYVHTMALHVVLDSHMWPVRTCSTVCFCVGRWYVQSGTKAPKFVKEVCIADDDGRLGRGGLKCVQEC